MQLADSLTLAGIGGPICFISSALMLPISYMLYVDAFGFAHGGIAGSLAIDAVTGIRACASLGMMLMWLARRYKAVTV